MNTRNAFRNCYSEIISEDKFKIASPDYDYYVPKNISTNPQSPTDSSNRNEETVNISYLKDEPVIPEIWLNNNISRQNTFVALQKWEGYVTSIEKNTFTARLIDLTNKGCDEEAKFSIEEISADDRDLVQPGAVFYWSIGYMDNISGQRIRSSIIKFRRLPKWTQREINSIDEKVTEYKERIKWE